MARDLNKIIMISVALIVVAVIVPLGLAMLGGAGDQYFVVGGVNQTLSTWVDPAVLTILTILVPIVAVIGILLMFIPRG